MSSAPPKGSEPAWLDWARALNGVAQTGIFYAQSPFDVERYEQVRVIAHAMLSAGAETPIETIRAVTATERGYATPKCEVRAAIFRDNRILLVREKQDGRWAPPGGFADVTLSPRQCVEKEVKEEANLAVRATKLLTLWDNRLHGHPPYMFHLYRMFFRCELIDPAAIPAAGLETHEVDWFARDQLPPLSTYRIMDHQIARMFDHHDDSDLPTDFE